MPHVTQILKTDPIEIQRAITRQNQGPIEKLCPFYMRVEELNPRFKDHKTDKPNTYQHHFHDIAGYTSKTPIKICTLSLNSFFSIPESVNLHSADQTEQNPRSSINLPISKALKKMKLLTALIKEQDGGAAIFDHQIETQKLFSRQICLFVPRIKPVEINGKIEARPNTDHMRIFLKTLIDEGFIDPVNDKDAILNTFGRSIFWDATHEPESLEFKPQAPPSPFTLSI